MTTFPLSRVRLMAGSRLRLRGTGIVTTAVADSVESAIEVAVTLTVAACLFTAGLPRAVYVTAVPLGVEVAESEPHAAATAHERLHVTPLFVGSLMTVAVKFCVRPGCTVAVAGEIVTAMAGA
jgi:hypothetical protein